MAQPEFTPEELATEEWRVIPDPRFDLYEVSNLGRVQRFFCSRGRKGHHVLRQKLTKYGYWEVQLWKHDKGVYVRAHQLVALAFIGRCPEGKEVNHIDRQSQNSRATNLEYLTHQENITHSLCNHARGERSGASKLTDELVRIIRNDSAQGLSGSSIGRKYNVSASCAQRVINKQTWNHVI